MGSKLDFYNMKRILEMEGGDGCITMWMYLMPLNCVLLKMIKMVEFMCILPQFKIFTEYMLCFRNVTSKGKIVSTYLGLFLVE